MEIWISDVNNRMNSCCILDRTFDGACCDCRMIKSSHKALFYDFQLDHFRCWWDFRSENDNWNIISLFLIRLAESSNRKKSKMSHRHSFNSQSRTSSFRQINAKCNHSESRRADGNYEIEILNSKSKTTTFYTFASIFASSFKKKKSLEQF